jgi:hypothetical protein
VNLVIEKWKDGLMSIIEGVENVKGFKVMCRKQVDQAEIPPSIVSQRSILEIPIDID